MMMLWRGLPRWWAEARGNIGAAPPCATNPLQDGLMLLYLLRAS